jgi:receptor-interacting serine/threonine-protein kinase 4
MLGDLNRCSKTGMTPLHWAAFHDFPDIIEKLLAAGANPRFRTQFDDYALIHLAAKYGHSASLNILIQKSGISTLETKRRETALHLAASNSLSCVKLLISAKCLLSQNSLARTPIDIALESGRFDIAMMLRASPTLIQE